MCVYVRVCVPYVLSVCIHAFSGIGFSDIGCSYGNTTLYECSYGNHNDSIYNYNDHNIHAFFISHLYNICMVPLLKIGSYHV